MSEKIKRGKISDRCLILSKEKLYSAGVSPILSTPVKQGVLFPVVGSVSSHAGGSDNVSQIEGASMEGCNADVSENFGVAGNLSEEVRFGDVYKIKLQWSGEAYAGCFFQLLTRNEYLRRPISLCGMGDGYVELAIRVAGSGTQELVSRQVGDYIECFGPLGRGFEIPECGLLSNQIQNDLYASDDVERNSENLKKKRYLVIGGGIGVAPLHPLVKELKNKTVKSAYKKHREEINGEQVLEQAAQIMNQNAHVVDVVLGYRDTPYLEDIADYVCVEDKNVDISGYQNASHSNVMPVLEKLLNENHYDDIYVCGPKKMLDAVALACMDSGYNPQLLTEAYFGCGVGACLVCTCEVNYTQKYARVCADGPMFRAKELYIEGAENKSLGRLIKEREEKKRADKQIVVLNSKQVNLAKNTTMADNIDLSNEMDNSLSVNLGGLELKSLLTTASGTFGFGREYNEFFDIGILGGISVKGLKLDETPGNPGRRIAEIQSGMINSVGLQNPGVEAFLRTEVDFIKSKNVAVIANINGGSVRDMVAMAERVNEAVDAVELNISCPNVSAGGMSFGTDPKMVKEVVSAVRQKVTKPLIVKLTPNVTDIGLIAEVCESEGADVLSMINTVTGLAVDPITGKTPLARAFGGMSGAAVKPVALRCINAVRSRVQIPILGMGGIGSARDVLEFLRCGATAVAIGTEIFRNPLLPVEIDRELRAFLQASGISNISEIKPLVD